MPPRRISLSLGRDLDRRLRITAIERDGAVSTIAAALIEHGLDLLDRADPSIEDAVTQALEDEHRRRAEVGRAAMRARWGTRDQQHQEDDSP